MKPLKSFEEFLQEGIVQKISPNPQYAKYLIKHSFLFFEHTNNFIEKFKITESTSEFIIKNLYDIIMELIRAEMFLRGYKSIGKGAHEAEVSFTRKLNFSEKDVRFLNELRYFRNGIIYYGTQVSKEYALNVFEFTKKIILFFKTNTNSKIKAFIN